MPGGWWVVGSDGSGSGSRLGFIAGNALGWIFVYTLENC